MEIDLADFEGSFYRTLTGAVIPRPIGWVSSRSSTGIDNLAPYSFFNAVSTDPPVLMFSPGDRPGRPDGLTDTARNVDEVGEFVVNVVTEPLARAMNETSAALAADESEFSEVDIERAPSRRVSVPRVAAAEIAFECVLERSIRIGTNTVLFGEVVYAHVDDALTMDGKLDVTKVDAVGRLAGNYYCRVGDRFALERPD